MAPTLRTGPRRTLNLEVYVGDANKEKYVLEGTDLTDATIEAHARVNRSPGTPIAIQATITPENLAIGEWWTAWDGELLRTLVETSGGTRWRGVWDLQITQSGVTLPTTWLSGSFTATYDVTRADA